MLDGENGSDTLAGGGGRDDLAGGLGEDQLSGTIRADDFSEEVERDTLLGGNRPEGHPAPVQALKLSSKEAEVPLFQSPQRISELEKEIDEVFLQPLLPELLEL